MNNLFELADGVLFPNLLVHGGQDGGSGLVGAIDDLLVLITEEGVSGLFQMIFPGITNMPNVHPLLVHFPIAFLFGFLIMELLTVTFKKESLRSAASWMLYLGTLGAMAAVAAGFLAAASVAHGSEVHHLIERHRTYGLTVLGLSVLLSLWRLLARGRFSRFGQGLHLLLAFVMTGVLTLGADLGGLMVFHYGVGVRGVEQAGADDHHHEGDEADHHHEIEDNHGQPEPSANGHAHDAEVIAPQPHGEAPTRPHVH